VETQFSVRAVARISVTRIFEAVSNVEDEGLREGSPSCATGFKDV